MQQVYIIHVDAKSFGYCLPMILIGNKQAYKANQQMLTQTKKSNTSETILGLSCALYWLYYLILIS